MKILFDNKVIEENTVLSGSNISDNYPLSNLKNRVLTRRTQSAEGELTLAFNIEFTSPININCFAFGYTNGVSIDITIDAVPIFTGKEINLDTEVLYFTERSASLIEIVITGSSEGVYLGSCGTGLIYTMPDPLNNFGVGIIDNNSLISNKYLVSYKNDGLIGASPVYNFANVSLLKKKEIMSLYIGVGSVVWLDAFEDNRNIVEPLYCSLSSPIIPEYNRRGTYQLSMSFEESK